MILRQTLQKLRIQTSRVAGHGSILFGLLAVMAVPLVGCAMSGPGEAQNGNVALNVAFDNLAFTRPVDLQHAPGREGELFVVEQQGRIHVFDRDPSVSGTTVFLDIRDKVNDRSNEEGLLGLAFHPNFASNGYFYINYTATGPRRTVVERYRVSDDDPDRADANSASVVIEIEQPYGNHNGGQVSFGPDGYLYIGMGDGGSGGDPLGHGQNLGTLLGAMLRIDVDNPSGDNAYGIPADNPFVDRAGARREIYAYGLRNPWRFSFDAQTGQLWAGDVGQNAIEEISVIEKGGNYGWNIMEGSRCYSPSSGCDESGLEPVATEYDHNLGVSVTGGFVYRGSDVPSLEGRYVFADYGSGRVWTLTEESGGLFEREQLFDTSLSIASFGVDADGELYVCAFDGRIYRFEPAG